MQRNRFQTTAQISDVTEKHGGGQTLNLRGAVLATPAGAAPGIPDCVRGGGGAS